MITQLTTGSAIVYDRKDVKTTTTLNASKGKAVSILAPLQELSLNDGKVGLKPLAAKTRWADENEKNDDPIKPSAADGDKKLVVVDDQTKKEENGPVHESMFVVWSKESLDSVAAFLKKLSPISTLVRPLYKRLTTDIVSHVFVAVMFPRVAEAIRRLINSPKSKTLVIYKIQPFHLHTADLPNPSWQSTFRFFVRLPKGLAWKPLKKHLDLFFERLRGAGLVESKQYDIEIPLTADRKHHLGQCVIWFDTKEQAERKKERHPDRQIKIGGRASEQNLPFVRYLLHNYPWYQTDVVSSPSSNLISCNWDRLPSK